ncbi:MAG TPA: T9SS type A sorting domain-containing protein, partial [Candidatus Kapabacteria bacterium]
RSETISIELYDVLGNKRMTLADGIYETGVHAIPIDTKDIPQGSYFVRLQTSGQVITKKLIVR